MKKSIFVVILLIIVVAVGVVIYFNVNKEAEPTSGENAVNQESSVQETQYKLEVEGKDMTPSVVFTQETFGEPNQLSEIPSCAFEGTDKVYTYTSYEITTYQDGDQERIYSVYFIDDQIATNEGVKIADNISAMTNAYGENYEQVGNQYTYVSGNVELAFIVENDVITSITYTLVTE